MIYGRTLVSTLSDLRAYSRPHTSCLFCSSSLYCDKESCGPVAYEGSKLTANSICYTPSHWRCWQCDQIDSALSQGLIPETEVKAAWALVQEIFSIVDVLWDIANTGSMDFSLFPTQLVRTCAQARLSWESDFRIMMGGDHYYRCIRERVRVPATELYDDPRLKQPGAQRTLFVAAMKYALFFVTLPDISMYDHPTGGTRILPALEKTILQTLKMRSKYARKVKRVAHA